MSSRSQIEQNGQGRAQKQQQQPPPSGRMYISNLLRTAWPYDITSFFESNGFKVCNIEISIDATTDQNPGYCFVNFNSAEEAQRAKDKLSGKEILGRSVVIDEAGARDEDHREQQQQQQQQQQHGGYYDDRERNRYREREREHGADGGGRGDRDRERSPARGGDDGNNENDSRGRQRERERESAEQQQQQAPRRQSSERPAPIRMVRGIAVRPAGTGDEYVTHGSEIGWGVRVQGHITGFRSSEALLEQQLAYLRAAEEEANREE